MGKNGRRRKWIEKDGEEWKKMKMNREGCGRLEEDKK